MTPPDENKKKAFRLAIRQAFLIDVYDVGP